MFDCAVQSLNFNKILFLRSEQIVSMSDFFFLWIYSFSAIPGLRTSLGRPSPSYLGATTLCKQISGPVPRIRSIQMKIQICITKVAYLCKVVPYLHSTNIVESDQKKITLQSSVLESIHISNLIILHKIFIRALLGMKSL